MGWLANGELPAALLAERPAREKAGTTGDAANLGLLQGGSRGGLSSASGEELPQTEGPRERAPGERAPGVVEGLAHCTGCLVGKTIGLSTFAGWLT